MIKKYYKPLAFLTFLLFVIAGCQTSTTSFKSNFETKEGNVELKGYVICSSEETPISNAVVSLKDTGISSTTNDEGFFSIYSDSRENYTLKAEKKEYENSPEYNIENPDESYLIELDKGEAYFEGNVLDPSSNIIPDAEITLETDYSKENKFETTSNHEGAFKFENLPEYDYKLTIKKDNYEKKIKTLAEAELNTAEDYTIFPQEAENYKIQGNIVQNETTSPIIEATVEVILASTGNVIESTLSDSTGSFFFRDIEPGFYKLKVSRRNYDDFFQYFDIIDSDIELNNLEIRLGSPDSEADTGQVSFEVSDADTGGAIPGVIISFRDTTYNQITDKAGEALFENIPASDYVIELRKDGYKTQIKNITLEPEDDMTLPIQMIYDIVGNLGNIKGTIDVTAVGTPDYENITVIASLNTVEELGSEIQIITDVTDEFHYVFRNLQVLHNIDGNQYKYLIEARYDDGGTIYYSRNIVNLEAGKTSIADIMITDENQL
ncbi:MAG: carboxypeptidase regulatory-like domain-containing protein [Candidatus Muiribacteriota bacterium]